ncbi:MAG: hypothetical protein QM638_21575 [Nocardioides sp.]|uniref:hypothetical protein n=1 Tax=Nocardioides sp. TaxID=35761 RepID=UPI0039E2E089
MSDQQSRAGRPERVRVTGPHAGRSRRTTAVAEIDAQTEVGAVYMRSLMRSQLRLALGLAAVLMLTVGLLPLLWAAVPFLRRLEVAGVPVAWLVLGAGCYPVLIVLAVVYVRRAERNERAFRELVTPSPDREPE